MTTTHAPVDLRALSEQAEAAFLEEFRRLLTEADITLDQAVSLKGARDHAKKAHGVDRMDAAAKQFEAEMFSADADKPDHMLVYIDPAACGLADEAFEHVRTMLSRSHPVMILDTPGVTVADRRKSKKDAPRSARRRQPAPRHRSAASPGAGVRAGGRPAGSERDGRQVAHAPGARAASLRSDAEGVAHCGTIGGREAGGRSGTADRGDRAGDTARDEAGG